MLFFKPKQTQFVGIDIGSGGMKMVEVRDHGKKPYLHTYAFTDSSMLFRTAPTDEERASNMRACADVLKHVSASAKTVSKIAIASLPQRDIFSTMITIPKTDQKLFATNVAREVEKLLSYPLKEAVLDTRTIAPLPAEAEAFKKAERVFVTAARRSLVQRYTDMFSMAGFELHSIETESFALIRSLVGNDPSPVVIIDIGKMNTICMYVERAIPFVTRTVAMGGDTVNTFLAKAWKMPNGDIEQMKIDLFDEIGNSDDEKLEMILEPFYQNLIKEIAEIIDMMKRVSNGSLSRPDRLLLTGGASLCPMLIKKIEQHFSIRTFIGDPWARIMYSNALKPVIGRIAPRFSVATGLAIRPIFVSS